MASETKNVSRDTQTRGLSAEVVADLEGERNGTVKESHTDHSDEQGDSRSSGRRRDGKLRDTDEQLCQADPRERGQRSGVTAT